jgi:hypothetical protein
VPSFKVRLECQPEHESNLRPPKFCDTITTSTTPSSLTYEARGEELLRRMFWLCAQKSGVLTTFSKQLVRGEGTQTFRELTQPHSCAFPTGQPRRHISLQQYRQHGRQWRIILRTLFSICYTTFKNLPLSSRILEVVCLALPPLSPIGSQVHMACRPVTPGQLRQPHVLHTAHLKSI